jgi:RES domain-containing protein
MLARNEAQRVLTSLSGFRFSGALHRAVHLFILTQDPSFNPLFSHGPVQRGGRFTPKGGNPALYAAEEPAMALAEANQVEAALNAIGAPTGPISPTVVYSFDVELPCVLDLADSATRASLQIADGEVEGPWEQLQARRETVPTQELGRWVVETGRFTAIRFVSAVQPGGHCMAVFTDLIVAPAYVRVYDQYRSLQGQLPAGS